MPNFKLFPHQQSVVDHLMKLNRQFFLIPNRAGMTTALQAARNCRDAAADALHGKQHKKKRWMSETYHKRIQKKWNKRFGLGLMPTTENKLSTVKELLIKPRDWQPMEQKQSESRLSRPKPTAPVEIHHYTPKDFDALYLGNQKEAK